MQPVRYIPYFPFALMMGLIFALTSLLWMLGHAAASTLGVSFALLTNPGHENLPNAIGRLLEVGVNNVFDFVFRFFRGVLFGLFFAAVYNCIFVGLLKKKPLKVEME